MNTLKKIKTNQKGFTLVELIVVVAILGVLAAVAIPNYMNYLYSSRVNTDIDTARAVLNVARTMTMTTGSNPGDVTDVLTEADMTNAQAATGGKLSDVLKNENFKGDDFSIDVDAGTKAGSYQQKYTVTEHGPLPTAKKSST